MNIQWCALTLYIHEIT